MGEAREVRGLVQSEWDARQFVGGRLWETGDKIWAQASELRSFFNFACCLPSV